MLYNALIRLRLPPNFCCFVLSLFANRLNQVFTAYGNTPVYQVLSGIDQGEIISPILWCIYYDALLCRIQNSSLGFKSKVTWKPNLLCNETSTLESHVPALAYMDDTLWMGNSKDDLNDILNIADSFYNLNSIKVNWDKSILLSSLPISTAVQFQFNNNPLWITSMDPKVPIRYLGIWISLLNDNRYIHRQVTCSI